MPSLLGAATPAGAQALQDADMVCFQACQSSAASSTVLQSFPPSGLSHNDTLAQKQIWNIRLKSRAGSFLGTAFACTTYCEVQQAMMKPACFAGSAQKNAAGSAAP